MRYYSASSSQKRLYFLQQMNLGGTYYNIPRVIEIEENLDVIKLEKTFQQIIARHESLRTSLEMVLQKLAQKILDNADFELEYFSVIGNTWAETIKQEMEPVPLHEVNGAIKSFIRPFTLSRAPLRCGHHQPGGRGKPAPGHGPKTLPAGLRGLRHGGPALSPRAAEG